MLTVAPASPQAPGAAEGEAAAAPGAVRGAEGTALPLPGRGRARGVCAGGVRARLTPLSPAEAQAAARGRAAGAAGAAGCVRTVRGPGEAAVGTGIPSPHLPPVGTLRVLAWEAGLETGAFVTLSKRREWELKSNPLPSLCSPGPQSRLRQMIQVRYSSLC